MPLELELQAVVNHQMWEVGIELSSSGRAVLTLSCRAIFPASEDILKKKKKGCK